MKIHLRSLAAALLLCLQAGLLMAAEKSDCPDNSCFDTQIISEEKDGSCTTYTLEISQDGGCRYALSHFNIEVACGQITDVSNSEGWAMEVGTTDPTTGITGIKVDDIKKFGESNSPQSFTVTYTICDNGSCSPEDLVPSRVAYKASTCVHYQDVAPLYIPMSARLLPTDASCAGTADGQIDLQLDGGTAPYQFNWSNGATSEDLEGITAGLYSLNITDAAGETLSLEAQVSAPEGMELQLTATAPSCANGDDASLDLSIEGGTGPFTYVWSNGATTEDLQNLHAGTYSLTVTDANGCEATASTTIANPKAIFIRPTELLQAGCDGTGGAISVEASYGTAPYTYTWSNGETGAGISELSPGTYTVTVTDAKGCHNKRSFQLSAATPPELTISAEDCSNTLTAVVSGGTAPYTYEWNTGADSPGIEISEGGTYELSVTDANGCSTSQSISVNDPSTPISLSFDTQQPACEGAGNGSIDLTAEGGSGDYTYEWDNGATTEDLENLEAGDYSVTVTDSNGCSSTQNITITAPASTISLSFETQQPTCQDNSDGSIDLSVTGGSGDYSFEWSNGESSEDLENLGAGSYSLTVTDSNGCTATGSVNLTAPKAIFIRPMSVVNANCQGEGGSITVEASYGTAPYTYEWSNDETGASISNLSPGTYTVTVTDANGCHNKRSFTISQESGPTAGISSVGCGNEFQLSATGMGGTAPYTYEWSNGETSSGITATAGTHWVTITDANGCSSTDSISLQETDTPLSLQASISHVTCAGGDNGTATIQASGGAAPYTFDWSNHQQGNTATGLKAGVYSVKVSDANGCSEVLAFTVTEPAAIGITAIVSNNDSCTTPGGTIEADVHGGTPPYTYEWNTGESSSHLSGLSAGSYTLTVADANNCVAIRSFTIEDVYDSKELLASLQAEETLVCKGSSTAITVSFTGEGPYNFTYSDGQAEHSITTSANPYLLEVAPEKSTTYRLLSVSNSCGEGIVSGEASITVEGCGKTPVCEDGCFSTEIISNVSDGNCQTITLQVNSDGNCRYALSHFNIALSCGTAGNVSNSGGWPMEVNALDPTTGVYGIKIDDIKKFGEGKSPQSFTVTYTVCSEDEICLENLRYDSLKLAYKAGQCVYYGEAEQPAPTRENVPAEIIVVPDFMLYPNPYTQEGTLSIKVTDVYSTEKATLTVSSISGVIIHQQQYEVSEMNNIISLAFEHLAAGTYVVKMEIKGYVITKQLYVL